MVSPGGSIIEITAAPGPVGADMDVPAVLPSLTASRPDAGFGVGRAGMTYRDLVPDRWGGRFIVSHIRVDHDADEGDIADWVHYHRIRFQLIYVASGWVDVVYEDQGPPFRMHAGDCVLQPPEIRHRVIRSSSGLDVIEVGCPAEHDTIADPSLHLPNDAIRPDRDFAGQRFVRHVAADTPYVPWAVEAATEPVGEVRDTSIGVATGGLAGVTVVRPEAGRSLVHDGELLLLVGVTDAPSSVRVDGEGFSLARNGSLAIPPGCRWQWTDVAPGHETLVVCLPSGSIRAG